MPHAHLPKNAEATPHAINRLPIDTFAGKHASWTTFNIPKASLGNTILASH
jgi:hypothetical protein